MTPIGLYIKVLIISRLARGPAKVEELDEIARRAVERLGVRYDWRIWRDLLRREVVVEDGLAKLSERGRWYAEVGLRPVAKYVERALGVPVNA
ncbi:MAG: hypothetical protein TU35_003315 [Thermoproteus sp. AZ2]|uniref:Uncharacterized protein n=1 Tax=Thermoproteus sp. AZ2 TaxID=1609232 RepID=A0ACC6V018_9CREN|nr:MAG: hypothetical protein TU35_09100 [Thermoproteus sp. AZ2]